MTQPSIAPLSIPAYPDVVVVMPAYNEAECIEPVVREWIETVGNLIVVNDGSKDHTGAVLDKLAEELPALRVIHQKNAGHGAALLHGYRVALDADYRWIFQTDSDGQFLAKDFTVLWTQRDGSPFLLGRRAARNDHPLRVWLSGVHANVVRALFGVRLADSNVPYRLMRADLLRRYLDKIPQEAFAPNVMLSILAARDGHSLGFHAVSHRERTTGVVSIRGWKTAKVGWLVFRQMLGFRKGLRS